jgi:hypothetical protein
LFICGCKEQIADQYRNKNEEIHIKNEYYNGRTYKEIPLKSDSIIHGYLKTFYTNGKLKNVVQYDNGVKNGIEKSFYTDGKIEYEVENYKGQPHGLMRKYSRNGYLKAQYSLFRGKYFGEQRDYDSLGVLETLKFIGLDQNLLFRYKIKNNQYSYEGSPVYIAYNKSIFYNNENVEIIYHFVVPPKFSYCLSYNLDNNSKIDVSANVDSMFYSKRYLFDKKCPAMGKHKYLFVLEMKDSLSGKVIVDTSDLDIKVLSTPF